MFKNTINKQIQELLLPYEEQLKKLKTQVKQLQHRVETLEQLAQQHAHEETVVRQKVEYSNEKAASVTKAIHTSAFTEKCLYLDSPQEGGFFASWHTTEQIGKSIYLLTTKDGINGKFSMLNTPDAIATATISVSQFVKTVCKVQGSIRSMPTHIKTVKEGCAVFENNTWRVTTKAVVTFM